MTTGYDLLLEIGCEEIPSRFMSGALQQLAVEAKAMLAEKRFEFKKIDTAGTPRRLTLVVRELADRQPDLIETIKGPPVDRAYDAEGSPTRALEGFLKSRNAAAGDIEEEDIKGALYIVLHQKVTGKDTTDVLPELLPRLIQKLNFPRPMYWQSREIRFARPIRWIMALYDGVPVSFSYAGINSANQTFGHRFLAPEAVVINSVEHYYKTLEEKFVIVDPERRLEIIRRQLAEKAAEKGGRPLIDNNLLEEVLYLVEYPVAVDGYYDEAYLDLPPEVLVTTMQHHQRYFPLVGEDNGDLLPFFVGISNNRFHKNIRRGYSKVLQARLADARFFFDEDCKQHLENYVEKLNGVVFLEKLGSLEQKRQRLVKLAEELGRELGMPNEKIEKTSRAAHLCKADLVTDMVREFTELQGVMGREYARISGEPEEVAVAIFEHYLPRFGGDRIPKTLQGAIVSLADRIDTLAGCFAVGIQPTGSQDPYALRRQAQGAVTILQRLDLNLPLDKYIKISLDVLATTLEEDLTEQKRVELTADLKDFFAQRIRFAMQEMEITFEVIEAVLGVPVNTVSALFKRAISLTEYLQGPLLDDVITAYNRVANLAPKEAEEKVNVALLQEESEKKLYHAFLKAKLAFDSTEDLARCLEELQHLRKSVDGFFDHVMVMVDDDRIRTNRLNLLFALKELFNQVADFSKLPVSQNES